MCSVSIIIGFKNREISRVKYCLDSLSLQTYTDFEVIFVDYGSDEWVSEEARKVIEQYDFARYVFNHTRGMVWNRSHALNSGVMQSTGEYLYLSDIDIVYSKHFLEVLLKNASDDKVIYNQFYLLPPDVTSDFESLKPETLELITKSAKGNCLVSRSKYLELRGYDEYYAIWGVEDNDLYNRCLQLGLKEEWTDNISFPTYHIWHPTVSNETKGIMPEKWMDEMIMYYLDNNKKLVRNQKKVGHCYSNQDRNSYVASIDKSLVEKTIHIEKQGFSSAKSLAYRTVFFEVEKLKKDQVIEVVIPKLHKPELSGIHKLFVSLIERILKKFSSPYQLVDYRLTNRDYYFTPQYDIQFFIWKMIKEGNLIKEYSIIERADSVIYYLSKNEN